jgi:transposase
MGRAISRFLVHPRDALENRTDEAGRPYAAGSSGHLLNWFRAKRQLSSGVVEGFNTKAKLTTRKAFGFRTCHALEVALYHTLGALSEPQLTHRFC